MKIFLAPMEGVIDHHMRALLTRTGGFHQCVTEFVRVVDKPLPVNVFQRICPELAQGSMTESGTPVTLQLLGGLPDVMAANAVRAVELGAHAIDINFGCPSRFVNRKAGGAVLLKEPQRIFEITQAVRQTVPQHITVSAKIRLGYESTELAMANAHAVEAANASFITVHARTKADGYKYPARWEWLGKINDALTIPMVANGDINSVEDFIRCRAISGCNQFMLGRGAIARPDLARQILSAANGDEINPMEWHEVKNLMIEIVDRMKAEHTHQLRILGRLKQWLVFLKGVYPQAAQLFAQLRQTKHLTEAEALLHGPLNNAA